MRNLLKKIETEIYEKAGLEFSNYKQEAESQEYAACRFKLDDFNMICRQAKITPKKSGQFVTFYKRNGSGIIEPLNESDAIDFYLVTVEAGDNLGQFVFPKSILIKKGILSSKMKEGKRAFRVYPPWHKTQSKQAENTQKWQLNYFYEIGKSTPLETVRKLLYIP